MLAADWVTDLTDGLPTRPVARASHFDSGIKNGFNRAMADLMPDATQIEGKEPEVEISWK